MAVVGFGKQPGAAAVPLRAAPVEMRDRLLDGIAALRGDRAAARRRGLGRVGRPATSSRVERPRRPTTSAAPPSTSSPSTPGRSCRALPFDEIDVLIIEQGGKDISGTTLDPNVTGRFWVDGLADLPIAAGRARSCCSASPTSRAGNALGIGFADFVPASLAERDRLADRRTSTASPPAGSGVRRSRMPMVLPDEESCIRAALRCAAAAFDEPKRVVRIRRRCTSRGAGSATPCSPTCLPAARDRRLARLVAA